MATALTTLKWTINGNTFSFPDLSKVASRIKGFLFTPTTENTYLDNITKNARIINADITKQIGDIQLIEANALGPQIFSFLSVNTKDIINLDAEVEIKIVEKTYEELVDVALKLEQSFTNSAGSTTTNLIVGLSNAAANASKVIPVLGIVALVTSLIAEVIPSAKPHPDYQIEYYYDYNEPYLIGPNADGSYDHITKDWYKENGYLEMLKLHPYSEIKTYEGQNLGYAYGTYYKYFGEALTNLGGLANSLSDTKVKAIETKALIDNMPLGITDATKIKINTIIEEINKMSNEYEEMFKLAQQIEDNEFTKDQARQSGINGQIANPAERGFKDLKSLIEKMVDYKARLDAKLQFISILKLLITKTFTQQEILIKTLPAVLRPGKTGQGAVTNPDIIGTLIPYPTTNLERLGLGGLITDIDAIMSATAVKSKTITKRIIPRRLAKIKNKKPSIIIKRRTEKETGNIYMIIFNIGLFSTIYKEMIFQFDAPNKKDSNAFGKIIMVKNNGKQFIMSMCNRGAFSKISIKTIRGEKINWGIDKHSLNLSNSKKYIEMELQKNYFTYK